MKCDKNVIDITGGFYYEAAPLKVVQCLKKTLELIFFFRISYSKLDTIISILTEGSVTLYIEITLYLL